MPASDSRLEPAPDAGAFWKSPWFVLGLATLVIHLLTNEQYGVFRDELYFIACGLHPAMGYVDQPPLVPLYAGASYSLFGPALLPLRLLPAVAMAGTVALTTRFGRLIGGGLFAQWLAGLCVLTGSVFLVNGLLLTTDVLQDITWLGASWCLVKIAQTGAQRWWLAFGAIVGISLLSKYLIAFYLVGLAVGLLATPLWRSIAKPWIYLGAILAVAIASPSVIWQAQHGWPFLELAKAGANGKNMVLSPLGLLIQQMLFAGPALAPIWLIGLWRFTQKPPLPVLRAFPIAYVVMFFMFVGTHGKAYYLTPIYPVLFAGGAMAIEGWLKAPAWRVVVAGVVIAAGLALAPFAIPILPVDSYIRYATALGLGESAAATENQKLGPLPQQYADMFGWEDMAAKVAAVYRALPPAERAKAVFFGNNYGEAGAIDVFGPPLGLPPAISGHNNYFLWGPQGHDGSVVILLAQDPARISQAFGSVQAMGRIDHPYAMPYETGLTIYVARQPKLPMAQLWPRLKHYE